MNLSAIEEVTKGTTKTTGVSPFMELMIEKVYPNPNQPRKTFDDDYIEELSLSIKENGLIQPIAVAKDGTGNYMIISGECRYKAHIKADLRTIKSHIITADEQKIDELSLIENIQRKDLTPFETARFIGKLWDSGNYALKKDLANKIGKSDTYVSKALSVLKLDDHIINDIEDNKLDISISVLDEISRVDDIELQNSIYEKYKAGDIKRDDIKKLKSEPKLWEDVEDERPGTKENKKIKKVFDECSLFQGYINCEDTYFTSKSNATIKINVPTNWFKKDIKYKITIEEL